MPALKRPLSALFPWLFTTVVRTDRYWYGNSDGVGRATLSKEGIAGSYGRRRQGTLHSTSGQKHGIDGLRTELYDLTELDDRSRRESQDPMLKENEAKSFGAILHTTELNIEYEHRKNPFGDVDRYCLAGPLLNKND